MDEGVNQEAMGGVLGHVGFEERRGTPQQDNKKGTHHSSVEQKCGGGLQHGEEQHIPPETRKNILPTGSEEGVTAHRVPKKNLAAYRKAIYRKGQTKGSTEPEYITHEGMAITRVNRKHREDEEENNKS